MRRNIDRILIFLSIAFLISCTSNRNSTRIRGKIYKEGWKTPRKGYPTLDNIPYRNIVGVENEDLFVGIQMRYDSIMHLGQVTDTLLDREVKFERYQIRLNNKFAYVRGVAGTIRNYIDNTVVMDISIYFDKDRNILKNYIRDKNSQIEIEAKLNLITRYQSEQSKDQSILKTYVRGKDEKYKGEVFWLDDRVIMITVPKKEFRYYKSQNLKEQLRWFEENWGHDITDEVIMQYIHGGFENDKVQEGELRIYLGAFRVTPKGTKDRKRPNIYYNWIFQEDKAKKESMKILKTLE